MLTLVVAVFVVFEPAPVLTRPFDPDVTDLTVDERGSGARTEPLLSRCCGLTCTSRPPGCSCPSPLAWLRWGFVKSWLQRCRPLPKSLQQSRTGDFKREKASEQRELTLATS